MTAAPDPAGVRAVMLSNPAVGLSEDVGLDETFLLDSLALTWLVHQLGESYRLQLDPEDPRVSAATSVRAIAGYLDELTRQGRRSDV
ncbi:MAG: hypothetical protein ACR2N4_03715 [Jatrophihabitans sp.]